MFVSVYFPMPSDEFDNLAKRGAFPNDIVIVFDSDSDEVLGVHEPTNNETFAESVRIIVNDLGNTIDEVDGLEVGTYEEGVFSHMGTVEENI